MTNPRTVLTALALAALIAAGAACSSTATTVEAADTEPTPIEPVGSDEPVAADSADSTDSANPEQSDAVTEADEPEAASSDAGPGTLDISFEDGRSWTLIATDCRVDPDSPFGVFFMTGYNDAGAELNVVESWPLDGDRSGGTAFIASFLDESGEVFVLDAAEVQQVGDSLTFTTGVYEGVFATETTARGTFTCTP